MKRLIKSANNEFNILTVLDELKDNSLAEQCIINFTENWLESNIEEISDLDSVKEKFIDSVKNEPNNLLEDLVDFIPEDVNENEFYNSDKKDVFTLDVLEMFDKQISETIDTAIDDEQIIRSETSDDNTPYGPGMRQHDFI